MTVYDDGSQACTVGVTHDLVTISDPGSYILEVDLDPLQTGDAVEISWQDKVLSGSTLRTVVTLPEVEGPQDENMQTVPFRVEHEGKYRIKQTTGTGRTIDWSVRSL